MYDVTGISNTLVDVCVEVDDSFLEKHELKKGQFHMVDQDKFNAMQSELDQDACKIVPAGSVPNTLMGLKQMGCQTAEFSIVGNDTYGDLIKKDRKENNMGDYIARSELPTGTVLALITPDAERTFAVFLGAAPTLTEEQINEEVIKQSKIIHFTGYEFESPSMRTAIRKAIDIAKQEKNILISFDLADPGVVQRNLIDLKPFIEKNVDILFANEEEAMEFTGMPARDAVEEIGKIVAYAVVKEGSKGSFIKVAKTTELATIKAFKVEAKDTTGAGDMYAAGILYGIIKELPMQKAGTIASYAAAKVVEQIGARLDSLDISNI